MNQTCYELKEAFVKNEAVCQRVNRLFYLLSNKGRFRIVCLLSRGEFCVNDILEVVGEGKLSNVSQQLKMLMLSDVVQRRRENQRIYYSLKDERIRNVIEFLQSQFVETQPVEKITRQQPRTTDKSAPPPPRARKLTAKKTT